MAAQEEEVGGLDAHSSLQGVGWRGVQSEGDSRQGEMLRSTAGRMEE
jgi:hypothetical protein